VCKLSNSVWCCYDVILNLVLRILLFVNVSEVFKDFVMNVDFNDNS